MIRLREQLRYIAALTGRVESLRHPPHKFAISFSRRCLDLLPGDIVIAIGNVRGNCAREQYGILDTPPIIHASTKGCEAGADLRDNPNNPPP